MSSSPRLDPAFNDDDADLSFADLGLRSRRARATSSSASSQASTSAQVMGGSLGDELNFGKEEGGLAADQQESSDDQDNIIMDTSYYDRAAVSMQDSVAATKAFLESLRSLSNKSTTTRSTGEETSDLESIAASILRQLRAAAVERESQVRQLREIVRELGREDIMRTLAATEDLVDLPEYSNDSLGISGPSTTKVLNSEEEEDDDQESHHHHPHHEASQDSFAVSSRLVKSIVASPSAKAAASDQLLHLRFCTTDLLSSLATLSEHAQVSRAATSDAARRLRALRGVLTAWKAEQEGVAASRAWIAASEASTPTTTIKPNVKSWTQAQLERAERALTEASARATQLLEPPRCEAMDRLVSQLPEGALENVSNLARQTAQHNALHAAA